MLPPRPVCAALVAATLFLAPAAFAQTVPTDAAAPAPAQRPDQRIERIRIDDALSRIDELRVGGETQSIMVSPKGGMPAYDVTPDSAIRGLTRGERGNIGAGGGTRTWKILDF